MSLHYSISHDSTESAVDYSSRDYWDRRFNSEESFEWLQPLSSIVPSVQVDLEKRAAADDSNLSLLHIGCGSSLLSNELRRLTMSLHMDGRTRILNVDFSPGAIELGRQHEIREFGDAKMHWAVLDLLDWKGTSNVCANGMEPFDVIVEKSCSDAIACGEDVELAGYNVSESGVNLSQTSKSQCRLSLSDGLMAPTVPPEIALAVYLGRITRPGATWIALSYSSSRFDYLKPSSLLVKSQNQHILPSLPWTIEQIHTLPITEDRPGDDPGAAQHPVYRPQIFHYVYILRRKKDAEDEDGF